MEEDEREFLVTVMETVEWEVLVTADSYYDAECIAEEVYREEGIVWSSDVEAVKSVEQ